MFIYPNVVVKKNSLHICPCVDTEDFLFSSLLLFFRRFPAVCWLRRPRSEAGRRDCGFSPGLKGPWWLPTLLPNNRPASPPRNPRVTSSSARRYRGRGLGPEPCSWTRGHVGQ